LRQKKKIHARHTNKHELSLYLFRASLSPLRIERPPTSRRWSFLFAKRDQRPFDFVTLVLIMGVAGASGAPVSASMLIMNLNEPGCCTPSRNCRLMLAP